MGREIKRVPLDFDYELDKVWEGYLYSKFCDECPSYTPAKGGEDSKCSQGAFDDDVHNCHHYYDPPGGCGYQIWENVSEGSPISRVFPTRDAVVEHLHYKGAGNAFKPSTRAAARHFVDTGWAFSMAVCSCGMVDGINVWSEQLQSFLRGFDLFSDKVLDALINKYYCSPEVVAHIDKDIQEFRERTRKFTECYTAMGKIWAALDACDRDEIPKEVVEAMDNYNKVLDEMYPKYRKDGKWL